MWYIFIEDIGRENMRRQDKFGRGLVIFLLVLTAITTFLVYRMPLIPAYIPEDEISIKGTTTTPQKITVSGKIENNTKFRVKQLEVIIAVYDDYGYVRDEIIVFDSGYEVGEKGTFEKTFTVTGPEYIVDANVIEVNCIYEKLPWYLFLIVGLVLVYLVKQLFANRKYYFDIEDKKVVIFASWRKAGVIVDGVLIKEGNLPKFKQEVALFNMKVAGHRLKFYSLNGDFVPSIRALVDDKPVRYTKVRQNPFVKMMDEGVVRGKGDITMKSKYETDGEEADRYNEERWAKAKQATVAPTQEKKDTTCPYCGAINSGNDKFCSSCGGKLD